MRVRRTRAWALLPLLLCGAAIQSASAQQQPGRLEFEVANVRPLDLNAPSMMGIDVHPGGRVVLSGLTLKSLIAAAFRLSYWQISGGDAWVEKDEYIIEAKPPES